jgi:hypothetical protein
MSRIFFRFPYTPLEILYFDFSRAITLKRQKMRDMRDTFPFWIPHGTVFLRAHEEAEVPIHVFCTVGSQR